MAKLPTHLKPDDGWDTPTAEEVGEAAEAVLGEEEPDGEEAAETGEEEAEEEDPAKPGKPKPKATTEKAEGADPTGGKATTGEEDDDRVYEIDGKRYTADEIREWQLGYMRNRDYTQKRQREASDTRQDREVLKQLIENQNKLLASIPARTDAADESEKPEALDPRVQKAIDDNNRQIAEFTEKLEQREVEREQQQQDTFLLNTFGTALDRLAEKYSIPKEQRDLYYHYILNQDPDLVDPATGKVTEQSIFKAVRREFLRHHGGKQSPEKVVQAAVDGKIATLKANKPQTPRRAIVPKRDPNHGLLHKGKKGRDWDSEANAQEFLEKMNEGLGISD